MGTECSAFGRVVFLSTGLQLFLWACVLSSSGRSLAAEKLVLPVVPRLKFARGVLLMSSPRRPQPRRSVLPFPEASVHQGSRWRLVFSSGAWMCTECSLFWFPRRVCLSEGLALPPTGFGCRELFIRSVSFRFRRCLRRRDPAAPGPSPTGTQRPYTVSSWSRDVDRGGQCWWSPLLCSRRSAPFDDF